MDPDDMKWWNECRVCGAVVSNGSRHREWHAERGDREPPKQPPGEVWTA